MPDPLLALGVLASLATPAHAGSQSAAPPEALDLSYELAPAEGRLVLKIYAKNTGSEPFVLDDNPYVRAATLVNASHAVALEPALDEEMFSRSGPMRRWVTVKPGERVLVGTTELTAPEGEPTDKGHVLLTVEAVTMGGRTARTADVPLVAPGT